MPKTRTKSGKQVLSVSITDAERALLERHCGPKEICSFLGRLLRTYDAQTRFGENALSRRIERIENYLIEVLERKEVHLNNNVDNTAQN